ncbi:MAG: energy-coupling factor ABC transporter permease [Aquabacterium sp.]|uniref:energy-coupling factor ABC transporter permease n=1 Tax=Aquabacterium sp. TaxID=1872578 RepID=UPI0025C07AEA|nr:energy-coupling factor ABC transporter permease [Aquabacterium sp.]MBI5925555.1 energy-coupling factor ABC transporter permease [Aquabacterium sp.]
MGTLPAWLDWALLIAALGVALLFKPWLPLRHAPLQSPWMGAMVLLPCVWWTQHLLPNGLALHVTGACLLVLMFGWPLAIWSLLPIALVAKLIEARAWPDADALVTHIVWLGVIPSTLALMLGLAVRRWMPQHLFVYILGRGFVVTALAVTLTGYFAIFAQHKPDALSTEDWMLANWLLGWGEAISTGMITAIFVAFKPEWMLTYSDKRYLPGAAGKHP